MTAGDEPGSEETGAHASGAERAAPQPPPERVGAPQPPVARSAPAQAAGVQPGSRTPAEAHEAHFAASRGVLEQLKEHKVLQWAIAYLGAALAIAQAHELVANAFDWPNVVSRIVVLTLIVGFPVALTVAWYHGHRALRRISMAELSILSVLLLVGAVIFTIALRRGEDPTVPAAQSPTAAAGADRRAGAPSTRAAAEPAGAAMPVGKVAATGGAEPLPNKVAVLPCENQSPNPDDAYFASGLHQDIIWQLDKLKNLNPIPRLTVLRYADTNLPIAAIASELMVRALLDCTVRYANNRVRIQAELIDATGLQTLWQGDYEPSLADIKDVFAVQAIIAMSIANALSVAFTPAEKALLDKPPTVSTDAYVAFLKGFEEPDYGKTIELFEQAAAADDNFALPKAALAFLWSSELINTNHTTAVAPEARAAHLAKVQANAERALELDPTVPFARSALTMEAILTWHWSSAYERFERARVLTPNDVTQYDIFLLSYLGRYDEAMSVVERGDQLYPNHEDNFLWRGWAHGLHAQYDEAAASFAMAVAAAPGERSLISRDWLARMEIARGNREAALEHLRLSEDLSGTERQAVFLPMWVYAYGRLGEAEDARRIFTEMQQREADGTPFGAGGWAMANLGIGDRHRALEWLETAAKKAAAHELDEGFFNLMFLRANVLNDDVVRQREFADVLGRIKGD
jgi:serine/threonine-protein kinase